MPNDTDATNPWSKKLLQALKQVNRPGAFCAGGLATPLLPGLRVSDLGMIGLPLSGGQAEAMKTHFQQAAYGKGTQTVVDTDVRRVWRLTPDRFAFSNPAWAGVIAEILKRVEKELGLEDQTLQAHLYDLLLYEKGGFFLSHRDGEKLDRMVATLVITLPSAYTGGELIVRHEGEEKVFDFGGPQSAFQTQYAAFYADCEHEVKPVTSGYRLCVVYNLTLSRAGSLLGAPRRADNVRKIASILDGWGRQTELDQKCAILLEHRYTEDGLSWDTLKGVDAARANVLAQAASQAGWKTYAALLTLWETGSCSDSYYDNDDDEEEEEEQWDDEEDEDAEEEQASRDGRYEMDELIERSLTADHWHASDGTNTAFGALPLDDRQVLPHGAIAKVQPRESYEGYTGNAGMTLERWYQRAAIVLWSSARHYEVLCSGSLENAVATLLRQVNEARSSGGAAARAECGVFLRHIFRIWPTPALGYSGYEIYETYGRKSNISAAICECIAFVNDPQLLHEFLSAIAVQDPTLVITQDVAIATLGHQLETFKPDLLKLIEASAPRAIGRNVRFLKYLCTRQERDADHALCRELATLLLEALQKADRSRTDPQISYYSREDEQDGDTHSQRARLLRRFVTAMVAINAEPTLSSLIRHAQSKPTLYPLQAVQAAAIRDVLKAFPAKETSLRLSSWIVDIRSALEGLTASKPQPPADQKRDDTIKCSCADCGEIKHFLRSPTEREYRFKAAQNRRRHIEEMIKNYRCDLTHTTDTRPRPQVLICTKSTASYRRLLRQYHDDVELLNEVRTWQVE